ncbi:hypothetical protein [Serratia ureilytica]|uniref:hypothetical protein n=1 Tax=Serratia ureilytica TaxID=300181 RepID=UPI001D1818C6|nr:hypothetical protein [Serratia ureilytica]MCC4106431.1 hypothetical protein [Serratia ureilytica]
MLTLFYYQSWFLFMFILLIICFFSAIGFFSVFFGPFRRRFPSFFPATVFQPRFSVFLWPLKPLGRRELQK